MTQIRNQLAQLNRSAKDLFIAFVSYPSNPWGPRNESVGLRFRLSIQPVLSPFCLLISPLDRNLILYQSKAQGKPFPSDMRKICSHGFIKFPPFHANGTEKDKLVELHSITVFFVFSLDDITKFQKTFIRKDQNLHSKLKSTMDILAGLRSNMLCRLCSGHNMRPTDPISGLDISQKDWFHKKKLGCELLIKYARLIPVLARDF
ncbi:leukemia inhibitory factor-like [Loxodonta africana]|uniref:leukemia inhibitory factor-like n=1 Tax=Loxodonta africana TaxID=9785 RepID=UPI0030D47A45